MLKKWFASRNVSTHSIVAALISAATIYSTVPAVKQLVDGLVAPHQNIAAWLALLVGALLAYKGAHSTKGQAVELLATAKAEPAKTAAILATVNAESSTTSPIIRVVPTTTP
jgi:hypothetical protein